MGKKSLIRSTSKKKRKIGLGNPKPKSGKKAVVAADTQKKITAKPENHAKQPETDLSQKAKAVKPEDKLTATETGVIVKSSAAKTDTGAPAKTERQPETVETDNYEPPANQKPANQKEESQPIETGVSEPDANSNGTEKMMDNIRKNTAAPETSKANAENVSESPLMTNTETIDEKNEPPQSVPDEPESSKVVINYGSEVKMETSTAAKKGIIISVAALLLIYALIISASVINTHSYYVKTTPEGVKVWQGRFTPLDFTFLGNTLLGPKLLIAIPGVQPPSPVKDVYTRAEIFNFIFDHYLKTADALIDQPGIPDVKKLDTFLKLAKQYADSDQNRQAAISRLNGLKQLFLLYKADIAMFKGTAPDLQIAAKYLEEAIKLATNKNQKERIQRQLEAVQSLTAELEQPQPSASVTENEKTQADEAKPTDQSPEKAEKNQAPAKSDIAEEKKVPADSAALKEEKQVAQEAKSDKQEAAAKTDVKEEKPAAASD